MTIKNPNNEAFLDRFRAKFGKDALMNTVGVAMYNAAHMAAMAIEKSGKVTHGRTARGPQGPVLRRCAAGER